MTVPTTPLATISLEMARNCLDDALKRACALDQAVAVAVLGRTGNLQAFAAMDGVLAFSARVSQDKAYTVLASGGSPTSVLEQVLKMDPQLELLLRGDPRMLPIGGGAPIMVDGVLAGSVGVSGTPTGDLDQELAEAAAAVAGL
jgi:uncharacterized protein GlcG (DUF336 family)